MLGEYLAKMLSKNEYNNNVIKYQPGKVNGESHENKRTSQFRRTIAFRF
jgi:hypothetical protein